MKVYFKDATMSYDDPNTNELTIPAYLSAVKAYSDEGTCGYLMCISQHSDGTGTCDETNELAKGRSVFELDMSQKEAELLIYLLSKAVKASTTTGN
jgi:hypothetical protein